MESCSGTDAAWVTGGTGGPRASQSVAMDMRCFTVCASSSCFRYRRPHLQRVSPSSATLLQAYLLQSVLGPEGPRRSTVVSTVLHEVQRKFFTLADEEEERGVPLVGGLKGVNVTR